MAQSRKLVPANAPTLVPTLTPEFLASLTEEFAGAAFLERTLQVWGRSFQCQCEHRSENGYGRRHPDVGDCRLSCRWQPKIVIVANPARKLTRAIDKQLDLSSFEIMGSNAVAADDVLMIAPRAIISATDRVPEISISRETLLHADSVPSNIGVAGSPNVVSSPVISTYQTDTIAIRTTMLSSWAKRDPRAVAWLSATNW